MNTTASKFGRKLKRLRTAARLSQSSLAASVGLKQQAVAGYEAGKWQPSWATVQRLAKALGVSTEAFRD